MAASFSRMHTPADRIEEIRVAWERDVEREMAASAGPPRAPFDDIGRHEPRVPLSRAMAERVHRMADLAATRLGYRDAYALVQTPNATRHLNAQALLDEPTFTIRLIGPVAGLLDDEALASLVGHELGHALALGPHASPPSTILKGPACGASDHLCALGTLASELTADRFALLAANGSLEAAVRLEVALQTLDAPDALGVQELAYLTDVCGQVEARAVPLVQTMTGCFQGYPSSQLRLFATWLFWRTDLHRELTGRGPGDLVLRDVDARLRAIGEEGLAGASRRTPPRDEPKTVRMAPPAPRSNGSVLETGSASLPAPSPDTRFADLAADALSAATTFASTVRAVVRDAFASDSSDSLRATANRIDVAELDELEAKFRALEREHADDGRWVAPSDVPEELEARFRLLEDAATRPPER